MIECKGHTDEVFGLAFHPDGGTLASASKDGTVRLWGPATGKELRVLPGHEDGAVCVAFSPDGRFLASGGEDDEVRIWDLATGEAELTCTGHRSFILSVAFSPDGQRSSGPGSGGASLAHVPFLSGGCAGPEVKKEAAPQAWERHHSIWLKLNRNASSLYPKSPEGLTSACLG